MRTQILLVLSFLMLEIVGHAQTILEVYSSENHIPITIGSLYIIDDPAVNCSFSIEGKVMIPETLFGSKKSLSFKILSPGHHPFIDSIQLNEKKICILQIKSTELNQVVVTAQIGATKVENAVQKITVLSREMIESKGAVNLKDLLQNEMNIRVGQDQVLGSSITMKGIGGEGVKILIDGVPVIGRNDGNIDLSQLNLANIERVEIIEGPLSVNYGSNAIAGTINLITKKSKKPGHQISFGSYYETSGHYNLNSAYNLTKAKHSINLHFGRNYFDGWNDGDPWLSYPKSTNADSSRYKSWKPKEQFAYGLRYSFSAKKFQINPYFDGFKETITNKGFPRPPYQIIAFDEIYLTNRINSGLSFNSKFDKTIQVKGILSYNYYNRIKNTFVKDLTSLKQTLTDVQDDQDTSTFQSYFARINLTKFKMNAKINYELGVELNHENGKGTRLIDKNQNLGDYALYGIMEWNPLKSIILNPGLRFNYNTVYGAVAVPSINIKFSKKHHSIRTSYAKGFRTPSLKELYLDFVDINHNLSGNPDLQPETSNHFQIWYTFSDSIKKTAIKWEVNPYFQQISNKISLAQFDETTSYSYFNLDEYQSAGVQTSLQVIYKKLNLKCGFNYLGIASGVGSNNFYYSPEFTSSASYKLSKIPVSIHAFYKYTGSVQNFTMNDDGTIDEYYLDKYHLLDIQFNFSLWKDHISLNIGAKNLLNVKNIASIGSSGAHSGSTFSPIGVGRTYYTSLNIQLKTLK